MVNDKKLIPGAFYWVIPEVDPDAEDRDLWQPGLEWQDEIQPARFNGWNAAGQMLWSFMGFDGSSDWPVVWVGEAIAPHPISSLKPWHNAPIVDVG